MVKLRNFIRGQFRNSDKIEKNEKVNTSTSKDEAFFTMYLEVEAIIDDDKNRDSFGKKC